MYSYWGRRCPGSSVCGCQNKHAHSTSPEVDTTCVVCRQAAAEVKSPIFKINAWSAVHGMLLETMPDAALGSDFMIDLMWCGLVDHFVHGCDGRKEGASGTGHSCTSRYGGACAVSYGTPIRHLHHETINLTSFSRSSGAAFAHMKRTARGLFTSYYRPPAARPPGSLLQTEPCWSAQNLSDVLARSNWAADRLPRAQAWAAAGGKAPCVHTEHGSTFPPKSGRRASSGWSCSENKVGVDHQ